MIIAVGLCCFLGGVLVGAVALAYSGSYSLDTERRRVKALEAQNAALIERLTGARLTPAAEAAPVRRAFGTDADEYQIEQQRLRASGKVLGEA